MLADDHIVQPAAAADEFSLCLGGGLVGVSQLPPVFRGEDSFFCAGLSGLVALKDRHKFLQPLRTYRQGIFQIFHMVYSFLMGVVRWSGVKGPLV